MVWVGTDACAVPADDDDVVVHPDHVDVRAVQGAEALRGEHGVGGPCCPAARRHVEDLVDNVRDGSDLVGDVHHGGAVLAAVPVDDRDDLFLRGRVEREQRLVTQQQPWPARQGLGDPQPLLLPARQEPDRHIRIRLSADRFDHGVHLAGPGPRQARALAVDAELDQVAAADRQVGVEDALLGDVAGLGAAVSWRPSVDGDRAGRQREQPEQHLQQRALARPVGPEDGQAPTRCHVQVQLLPDHMVAEPHRGAAQRDRGPAAAVHVTLPAHAEWLRPGRAARPGSCGPTAASSR